MSVRELNLIPYEVRAKNKQRYINLGIIAICIAIIAGLALFTIVEKVTIRNMKKEVADLDTEIASYNKDLKEKSEITTKIESLEKSIATTKYLIDERTSTYERIKGLEQYVPSGLLFSTIEDKGNSMTLTGHTTNYYLITEFAANLQESKVYSKSKIDNITTDTTTGKVAFTINVKIEKGVSEE